MKSIIRFLPVVLLIILMDYGFFLLLWDPVFGSRQAIWNFAFWMISLFTIIITTAFPQRPHLAIEEPIKRDIQAGVLLSFFAKIFGILIALVLVTITGLSLGILNLFGLSPVQPEVYYSLTKKTSLIFSLVLLALLLWGMIRNRYRYKLHKVKVPIDDLPDELDGFTLVQISDIHSGSFTHPKKLVPGIELINKQNADLICFTGDLVNSISEEIFPYIDNFSKLKAKYGVFAILGNHDYGDYAQWKSSISKKVNMDRLIEAHAALSWQLLRDDAVEILVEEKKVSLIGVENISAKGRFKNYGDLQSAHQKSNKADLKILMSHDPSHWRAEVLGYPDIHICLSGHTHGMQFGIELGNFFKWSPVKYAYKEWAGLYQEGKQYLYVNRGFGFLGYPGRVGILPEVTRIEFVKTKN